MAIREDYSLTGPNNTAAVEAGLADGEWWQPAVDPSVLRGLQQRSNWPAIRDTALWLGLIVASGVWAYTTLWSWWSIPAFALYGALVGGAADSRWHECGHGTMFANPVANETIYYVASFGLLRGPTVWRWSHFRHHTDTIVVGRDYEIAFQRGMGVWRAIYAFTGVPSTIALGGQLVRHASGRIDDDVATFVPGVEHRKLIWESRVFVAIVLAAAVASIAFASIVPLLFVGLPALYGAWLVVFFGITQHCGLSENVLDHRRNTRTVLMNPVFRFLYSNMNYHVEHHIYPSVPYHALPSLHTTIADQLAPALPNTWTAYRQIFATVAKQHRDPSYEVPLDIPEVSEATHHRVDPGIQAWVAADPGTYDLGDADALEVGEIRAVDVDGTPLILARYSPTDFCLAASTCTHQDVALVGGAVVDGQIECPKHNARFDCRTGAVTRKPARQPLAVYSISEIGGRLITDLHRVKPPASTSDTPMSAPSSHTSRQGDDAEFRTKSDEQGASQ